MTTSRSRASSPDDASDLRLLLHRLNNQLGIILAHSELLESKLPDEQQRARAAQVVAATLEAMTVSRSLRERCDRDTAAVATPPGPRPTGTIPTA